MGTFFMLTIAGTAVFFDLRTGRIPNAIILTGLSIGLCYQIAADAWLGFLQFLGGAGLPAVVLGALFYFRMLGAGDIKLLCVMGGFLGASKSFVCTLSAVLAGGVLALFLVIRRRNFQSRIRCLVQYCRECAASREWKAYDEQELEGGTFCFSIAILMSVLLHLGGVY